MSTFRLEDVLETWLESFKKKLYTSEPGWVTSFDKDKFTASVQPAIQQSYKNESGQTIYASKPVIQNVRVLYPGGKMLYQLKPGDPGELLFASSSLDNWSPGATRAAPPSSDRGHHLSDAIFIPGFVGRVQLGNRPGEDEVVMAWDKVKLGASNSPSNRSPVFTKQNFVDLADQLEQSGVPPLVAIGEAINAYLESPAFRESPVTAVIG